MAFVMRLPGGGEGGRRVFSNGTHEVKCVVVVRQQRVERISITTGSTLTVRDGSAERHDIPELDRGLGRHRHSKGCGQRNQNHDVHDSAKNSKVPASRTQCKSAHDVSVSFFSRGSTDEITASTVPDREIRSLFDGSEIVTSHPVFLKAALLVSTWMHRLFGIIPSLYAGRDDQALNNWLPHRPRFKSCVRLQGGSGNAELQTRPCQ